MVKSLYCISSVIILASKWNWLIWNKREWCNSWFITYRYTLINASLAEKEALKSKLEAINKENAQLEVTIESGMSISMIEQLAKETLGMQKLDNNQKVYINLDKKDYTESSQNNVLINTDSWWDKFIKVLTGK